MSEIRATTISDAAGTGPITLTKQSAAKAWVNFNGSGTIATRNSQGISGLVDNGTGNYTINFTSAMSDVDYAVGASVKWGTGAGAVFYARTADTLTASSYQCRTRVGTDPAFADPDYVYVTFHGDLA